MGEFIVTPVRKKKVMAKKKPRKAALESGIGRSLPRNFKAQARSKFRESKNPDVSFEQFLEHEKAVFLQRVGPSRAYHPSLSPTMTACGNGDLETLLDPAQW